MNSSNSGIRCQLQKSSKNRPGSSGRDATIARSLGSARLRSIPRSTSATCSGGNAARTQTAPSRSKSS
jgi:hypothetical protein